jgi:hypothetical protein
MYQSAKTDGHQHMKKLLSLLVIAALPAVHVRAQKPFTEGTIHYKVKLQAAAGKTFDGDYVYTVKGGHIRKDIQLSNGYRDILIIDCDRNLAYSLQNYNGRNYAIQLSIAELTDRQKKYAGFTLKPDKNTGKIIAGITANKGELIYPDGNHFQIYYSNEWYPERGLTYELFPDARFLPLSYAYVYDNNITMFMEADSLDISPVENGLFRIPGDAKIITNAEYKQLRK